MSNTSLWLLRHPDERLERLVPNNRLVRTCPGTVLVFQSTISFPRRRWRRVSWVVQILCLYAWVYHFCLLCVHPVGSCSPVHPLVGFWGGWGAEMMNKHTSNMANQQNTKRLILDQDSDDEPITDLMFYLKNENWQRFLLLVSLSTDMNH